MGLKSMTLEFTEDAIDALAEIAVHLNSSIENIGARRLQTVMERVLDEISFTAPDQPGSTITIDSDYVRKNVGDLAQNTDLSRFILYGTISWLWQLDLPRIGNDAVWFGLSPDSGSA
jgi:ATP-dependent HslUV protease ATP-binding subunit HslU